MCVSGSTVFLEALGKGGLTSTSIGAADGSVSSLTFSCSFFFALPAVYSTAVGTFFPARSLTSSVKGFEYAKKGLLASAVDVEFGQIEDSR